MQGEFLNQKEIETAIRLMQQADQRLDTQERLLLNAYRRMILNDEKEMSIAAMDQTNRYNTTIIATGYTAFFAGWIFFRQTIEGPFYDLSMLFALISVLMFVAFNVWQSVRNSQLVYQKIKAISDNKYDIEQLYRANQEANQKITNDIMKMKKWWILSLFLTIIPGFGGGILFMAILIQHISIDLYPVITGTFS